MANDDDVFTRRNYYYDRGNVNSSSSKTTNCIEIFEREGMKRGRTRRRRRRREQDFELKININLCMLTLCKHDERASSDRAGAGATQRWQCTLRIARTRSEQHKFSSDQ